jgi:hypothetical protein
VPALPGKAAPAEAAAAPSLRYRRVPIPGPLPLIALRDSLGGDRFLEVLKINRLDLRHIRAGDSLLLPVGPSQASPDAALRSSPFPRELPAADSLSKTLFVAVGIQAFAAYEHGRLVRWGPTSTGKQATPTPTGLYHTNWKDKERHSTVDEDWLLTWYVNLDNFAGVSFHQYELPGYPASHSCIRLLEEDASWLYAWVEQWRLSPDGSAVLKPGTPVFIFGQYAYGKRPLWKRLPEHPEATSVPVGELAPLLQPLLRGPS